MPHRSERAVRALTALRLAATDATSASALAERSLAILQPALRFDGGEILSVDPNTLLFTRVLAHHGQRRADLAYFLQHVHLVTPEPSFLDFQGLLRDQGGACVVHERFEHWLRVPRPNMSQASFTRLWRRLKSPPGGGLRYGLAHRGRWVAVLQCARWEPGEGFRAADLEVLDSASTILAAAFAHHLEPRSPATPDDTSPRSGHLVFDDDRRLVVMDEPARSWLDRLPLDGLAEHGMVVPVAAQSVVNFLAGGHAAQARVRVVDDRGVLVALRGARAFPLGDHSRRRALGRPTWFSVGLSAESIGPSHPALADLSPRQAEVALLVAQGHSDHQMSTAVGVSLSTIRDHIAGLHARAGTSRRSQLVAVLASTRLSSADH